MNKDKLFDDDACEFLLPCSEKKVGGLAEVNVFSRIFDSYSIHFDSLLLDQSFRFRF